MYLAIGALLSISHLVLTSPLHELALSPAHRLQKRDWVLECRDDVPVPVESDSFEKLSDLCKGFPHGFGLYCDAVGNAEQRMPVSLLSRMYGNNLAHVCLTYCRCQNLAPDAPVRVDAALDAQFQQCSMSTDMSTDHDSNGRAGGSAGPPSSSTACTRSGTSSQAYFEGCECNEYWYGRPNNQDCHQALVRLPDHGITRHKYREFLPLGHTPQQSGAETPPIRAPIVLTYGHCTVAALLPEGPGTQNSILVDTLELNNAAEDLRDRCVQHEGIGGKFQQAATGTRDNFHQLPPIVMFAPDSKWKDFLDLKYSCDVKAEGSAECKPIPGQGSRTGGPRTKHGAYSGWKYMGNIGSQGWTPVNEHRKNKCSGTCNDPSNCDIKSDCLCAAPNRGVPVSSSWGHHTCMHVVGAAAAMAAASISPNGCRGRCLIQEDGTLDIGRPLNATNATIFSFDVSRDLANQTGSVTSLQSSGTVSNSGDEAAPSLTPSNDDPTSTAPDPSTSDSTAGFPTGPEDYNLPAANTTGPATNSTPIVEVNGVPAISNGDGGDDAQYGNASASIPGYVIFNDTSPDLSPILTCPCNCTYVSAACCFSQIVFEDPSMQVPMEPLPANASVCCDPNSGFWLPKPSGECDRLAANFTEGFIRLGNVKWDNNASRHIGFPDDEGPT